MDTGFRRSRTMTVHAICHIQTSCTGTRMENGNAWTAMNRQITNQNMTVITCRAHSAERRKMAEEKNLENKVKDFLKEEGCWYIKYWAGGGFTKSGVPDLLISCDGYFLGVEVKAEKGTPSDLQLHEIHKIQESGGIAFLLFPRDLELFKNLIRAIKGKKGMLVNTILEVFDERMKEYE